MKKRLVELTAEKFNLGELMSAKALNEISGGVCNGQNETCISGMMRCTDVSKSGCIGSSSGGACVGGLGDCWSSNAIAY
ncbi:MAG: hypothetical protein HOO91_13970 [Bacteroidales bacterium]|nr:hypothetical protein [Bacteroidales bacterium]